MADSDYKMKTSSSTGSFVAKYFLDGQLLGEGKDSAAADPYRRLKGVRYFLPLDLVVLHDSAQPLRLVRGKVLHDHHYDIWVHDCRRHV